MKRVTSILAAIIVPIIVAATAVSFAQNSQQTAVGPGVGQRRVSPEGTPPPRGDLVVFVGSEMGFGGKIVKGAPYSAEAITETIQTLADGNRIVNKTSSLLYRDSEGRTRREQTLKPITTFAPRAEPIQTIFINDPVAGVSYSLNTRTKVAHKNVPLKLEQKLITRGDMQLPSEAVKEQKLETKIEARRAPVTVAVVPEGPRPPGEEFTLRAGSGDIGFVLKTPDESKNVVNESLGTQLVEGVAAEGTRSTLTIPAGEIGNERDIQVVSERWYSPELRMVVMTKHSDPRTGETIYRLTNINRLEPAKDLFELPAGYTVTEGYKKTFDFAMPAKIKKPE
ncbi:MAG TPA: hypothetical protein VLA93_16155 [Pyrinomonadaceae bacterium]|nr:hypothetical protein [Pyrinomonadaceae bacterium]